VYFGGGGRRIRERGERFAFDQRERALHCIFIARNEFGDGHDVDFGRAANLFARSLRGRAGRLPGVHDSTIGIEFDFEFDGEHDEPQPVNAHTISLGRIRS